MNQLEKVAMKSFNHFMEEGDGNIMEARVHFSRWVGEFSPMISESGKESWKTLVLAIDWCFQDGGYRL